MKRFGAHSLAAFAAGVIAGLASALIFSLLPFGTGIPLAEQSTYMSVGSTSFFVTAIILGWPWALLTIIVSALNRSHTRFFAWSLGTAAFLAIAIPGITLLTSYPELAKALDYGFLTYMVASALTSGVLSLTGAWAIRRAMLDGDDRDLNAGWFARWLPALALGASLLVLFAAPFALKDRSTPGFLPDSINGLKHVYALRVPGSKVSSHFYTCYGLLKDVEAAMDQYLDDHWVKVKASHPTDPLSDWIIYYSVDEGSGLPSHARIHIATGRFDKFDIPMSERTTMHPSIGPREKMTARR